MRIKEKSVCGQTPDKSMFWGSPCSCDDHSTPCSQPLQSLNTLKIVIQSIKCLFFWSGLNCWLKKFDRKSNHGNPTYIRQVTTETDNHQMYTVALVITIKRSFLILLSDYYLYHKWPEWLFVRWTLTCHCGRLNQPDMFILSVEQTDSHRWDRQL